MRHFPYEYSLICMGAATYTQQEELIQQVTNPDARCRNTYDDVSESFRTESIMKYTLTTTNTR